MEIEYIPEIETIFIKPVGHMSTRIQLDNLVLEFEKIHKKYPGKIWVVSDIREFMIKSMPLLKYFAQEMIGMDEKRHGTIFILNDPIRKTGIKLLKHYRKVNFYTASDRESALKIIQKQS